MLVAGIVEYARRNVRFRAATIPRALQRCLRTPVTKRDVTVRVRANIDRGMVWVVRTLDRVCQRCFGVSSEWPVATGRYYVGRKNRPVAISTLGSLELMHRIGRREEFAIIGKTFTENIGIEKVIQNIVSNSAIRFLILYGHESPHKVGQSFIALKRAGVDSEGRIVGSQGRIPVLRNLSREQISRFREQVELVDLIGEQRIETIMATVAELNSRNLAAFQGNSMARSGDVEQVCCWHRESIDYHSDPAGFFVIQLNRTAGEIILEHYDASFELLRVLHGKKALEIYSTIVRNGWVTVLGHAAYLGRELAKAELALQRGWIYEQNQDVKEL
jgi:tetrahydromethanopterin S-methyltransferase subunit A